jgi:serine/threonine-protein kinase
MWTVAAVAAVLLLLGVAVAATAGGLLAGLIPATGGLPSAVAGGYVHCGDVFCPATPMCWDGLNAFGGRAQPPTAQSCDDVHRWETIAVTTLPADAVDIRQDELLATRPDIAAFCSTERQQQRALDPELTEALDPEPWPVNVDGQWLLYCLGGGPEHAGVLFRTGA